MARSTLPELELTTREAADLLNVSLPLLLELLDLGAIPFRRIGNRRIIQLEAVVAYRTRNEARRREVADELTGEAQAIGLQY